MREKEVTGSMQCCAINKCHCGKASLIGPQGEEATGSVQCCAINKYHSGKASMTIHEGK